MQLLKVKNFSDAAPGAVEELMAVLPSETKERLAAAFQMGASLSLALTIRAEGPSIRKIVSLSLEAANGERVTIASVDGQQPSFH